VRKLEKILENTVKQEERLYVVPRQRNVPEYSGSILDKEAYYSAGTKEEVQMARKSIYEPKYRTSPIYKKFDPPENFSRGSVERCKDPNIYKISYGDKTIYRAMINGKAVVFTISYDNEGNKQMNNYVCKKLDEQYENQEHLRKLAFNDDSCKLRTHVLEKHGLISEGSKPYFIRPHTFEKDYRERKAS